MDKWINLTAIWQIVVVGLLAGAGLPALVAIGLRALVPSGAGHVMAGRNPGGVAIAAVCFAVVLAAIGYGIYLIVQGGH
jgi:hypothetical protein